MHAMVLDAPGLALWKIGMPLPLDVHVILLKVKACLPLISGHELVGIAVDKGKQVDRYSIGQILGAMVCTYLRILPLLHQQTRDTRRSSADN